MSLMFAYLALDVSVGIHLEAIMKTPEWQQRRSNLKALKAFSKVDRIDKSNLSLDRPKKLDHRRRKYSRLLKSSTPNTSDASEFQMQVFKYTVLRSKSR